MNDTEALNWIAARLSAFTTEPAKNPVDDVVASVIQYVKQTGRRTDVLPGPRLDR